MKRNRPTCSPWLHARLGEQLGLSPRSSGRLGGLFAGAERTRRSVKGAHLSGRDNRKQNSDPSSYRGSGGVRDCASSPCRYPATRPCHPATAVEIKLHHYPDAFFPCYAPFWRVRSLLDTVGLSRAVRLPLWKDADPDIRIYKEAKAEYSKLQQVKVCHHPNAPNANRGKGHHRGNLAVGPIKAAKASRLYGKLQMGPMTREGNARANEAQQKAGFWTHLPLTLFTFGELHRGRP